MKVKVELLYSPREFDPAPEDLIGHYLKNHILKQSYPELGAIQEDTIYGEEINPWDKFCDPHDPYPWKGESTSTPSLFLFTRLSDVGNTDRSSSIQKHRRAGCGTWHGTSSLKKVTSSADNREIGHYRILSFRSDTEETKGQWTMYEYSISATAFPEILGVEGWQNQVVCRIKRDDNKSNIGGKLIKNDRKPLPMPVPNKRNKPTVSVNSEDEEEEKPVVDNVSVAEFVSQAMQEPHQVGCSYHEPEIVNQATQKPHQVGCSDYGELTDPELSFDMDELFNEIECD